jgi:hypothetical protein
MSDFTQIRPHKILATMLCTIFKPNPVPAVSLRVVKKVSKILSILCAGMPFPLSVNTMLTLLSDKFSILMVIIARSPSS